MSNKPEEKLTNIRKKIGKYIIWIEVLLALLIIFTVF